MITSYEYDCFDLPRNEVLQDQYLGILVIIAYECCAYVLVKIESTLCYQSKYSLENVTEWVIENFSLVNKSY